MCKPCSAIARTLEFQLVAGPQLATEPFATPEREPWTAVVMLQPLRAGVTYVSDLQPLGYRHIPFLDMAWPFRRDRSVAGGRLRHERPCLGQRAGNAQQFARWPMTRAAGTEQLHAEVAIDERSGRQGSVIFRVYVQGGTAAEGQTGTGTTEETTADHWSMAYESAVVRGGDPATADPRRSAAGTARGLDCRLRRSRRSVGPRQSGSMPDL